VTWRFAAWRVGCALSGVTLLTAIAAAGAAAQGAQRPSLEPGSELTVFVMTMGQGDQVWERFGHNALWISDAARGTNKTYNWGIFDAADPGFIFRFVRGRMRYWMESVDVERVVDFYRSSDRSITVQRLALTPAQRAALREFVEWNAREENKYYWYDYFRDNCSTRLRDAVDRALGGAIRTTTSRDVTPHTYRSESVRLMEGMPFTQAGIAIGLGPAADRALTGWEEMFVPMRMRDRLREIRVAGPDGSPIPLVAAEHQLYVARRPAELQSAPPLTPRYAAVGALLALLLTGLGLRARDGGRAARLGFGTVASLWTLVAGVCGLLLLFLWFGTHHVFAYRNENLLQFNPLAVALALLVPLGLRRAAPRRRATQVALIVVAMALLGVALKALPWFQQRNLYAMLLVLPTHFALAWVMFGIEGAAAVRSMPAGASRGSRGDAGARRASGS
jgi:hypothetical protein